MSRKSVILILFLSWFLSLSAAPVRVACVGNSVTYGYLLQDRENTCYPAQLQRLLGTKYEVRNFGYSGSTLLRKGHRPYWNLEVFRDALDYRADIVVIHLGLNDTDPRNWPNYNDEFIGDYRAMIDSFRTANPKSQIYICEMTPIFERHHRWESGTRDWHRQIQQKIRQVAKSMHVGLIDLFTPLHNRPDLFHDALHPNVQGAGILAKTVYKAITGDYGPLTLPPYLTDHAVLQRFQPIVISGTTQPNTVVKVTFGRLKGDTLSNDKGEFKVILPALADGGPYEMTVTSGKEKKTLKDLWIGEVWLCSGQSNMRFMTKQSATAKEDSAAVASQNQHGRLHLYNMRERWSTDNDTWAVEALKEVNNLNYFDHGKGWEVANAQNVADFSAVAYHFGRVLADSLKCPIGLILNAIGGSPAEAWVSRWDLEEQMPKIMYDWQHNDYLQPWVRERALKNTQRAQEFLGDTAHLQRHPYQPCYLFETGIEPLRNLQFKGVIWYQGESNAHNIEAHEKLFPMMEQSWRKFFGKIDLPFYTVQLSSLNRPSWPQFRDSQRYLSEIQPFTYMAVCSDYGDPWDVHPRQKRPVGERLAACALYNSYGKSQICPSGPMLTHIDTMHNLLLLTFDWGQEMHGSDGQAIRGFEVCGEDGVYYPAHVAVVPGGTALRVWSENVEKPLHVRYGWQPYTDANLVNRWGMPASTMRD